MSEHILFCDFCWYTNNWKTILTKLEEFFKAEKFQWKDVVDVTTDGAAAMVGRHKGLNT